MDIENKTTITPINVKDITSNILKGLKLKFNLDEELSDYYIYEVYLGSETLMIQVETDTKQDDLVILTVFDEAQTWEEMIDGTNQSTIDDLDIGFLIEDAVSKTKRTTKVKAKIIAKIEQIKELCNENDLDVDDFIEINQDIEI